MLSNGCQYAMQAAAFLARTGEEAFVPVRRIGAELGLSAPFLAKVLRALTECGLLRARRGPGGGVVLGRPPDQISLMDIVLAIDGPALFEECVLGLPGCGDRAPCPLHEDFGFARSCLAAAFEELTLASFASKSSGGSGRTRSQT